MKKLLKKLLKKQKKLIKEVIKSRIKLYKSELRTYKYLQKMETCGKMYFPPYISIESIIDMYAKEIERLKKYGR